MYKLVFSRGLMILILAAFLGACASTQNTKSTGEIVDDAVISTKVKTALARAEDVSALEVKVETFKGLVQLSGFVDSDYERERAEEVAWEVRGVRDVENKLSVKR